MSQFTHSLHSLGEIYYVALIRCTADWILAV